MSAPETIGVYGGAFDPPHCGHLLLVAYALAVAPIDRVVIVPTFQHAFGKSMAPYEHRVAACELAFHDLARTSVDRIEQELGGASYTVRTLEALRARHPGADLRLLVGADTLPDLPRWKDVERIRELAPLFVIGRSGFESAEDATEMPAISSTRVRELLAAGKGAGGLVPTSVERYCAEHGLYRGA